MKLLYKALSIISVLVVISGCAHAEGPELHPKILFVGNSLTYYNDVPMMVAALYTAVTQTDGIETDMLAEGGYSIEKHLATGVLGPILAESAFTTIILQDFGGWPLCPTDIDACSSTTEPLSNVIKLVKSYGARPIWYSTYHQLPGAQRELSIEAQRIAAQLDVEVADVGAAMQTFTSTHPSSDIFLPNHHPDTLGSWIAAATIVRSLIGTDLPESIKLDDSCRKIWQGTGLTADRLASRQEQPQPICDHLAASVLHEIVLAVNKSFNPDTGDAGAG